MSIFDAIAKDIYRHRMGHIPQFSGNYIFSEDGYTNPQNVHFKAFKSDDGRMVSLVQKPGVNCPVTDGSIGDFPVIRGVSKVPLATCKKCQHWRKVKGLLGGCCVKWQERSNPPSPTTTGEQK